jgi:hypothetical protein
MKRHCSLAAVAHCGGPPRMVLAVDAALLVKFLRAACGHVAQLCGMVFTAR